MRTRIVGAAAAAAISAGIAVTSAAPAHAAGWGTISSSTVGKYLSGSATTNLGRSFVPAQRVAQRYCVVGRGVGSASLQPVAYSTTVTFSNSSTLVTRCTKSWTAPSGYMSTMQPVAFKLSGTVYISKVYVQRYYSGPIPV